MGGVNNNTNGTSNYNMIAENAKSGAEKASAGSMEAQHMMEGIMNSGMKFAGALMGMLGGVLGSCGGGCGGI